MRRAPARRLPSTACVLRRHRASLHTTPNTRTMSAQNIVVLGGSGNVGGPAVKSLLEAGHKVVAPYRSADALEKIKKSIGAQASSPHFHPVHADIASPEGAAALAKAALETFHGKVDHVVSSVGAWQDAPPLHEIAIKDFKAIMNSNYEGHLFVYAHLAKHMLNNPGAGYTFVMGGAHRIPSLNMMYMTQNAILNTVKVAQAQTSSTALRVNALNIGFRITSNEEYDALPASAKASGSMMPSRDFGPLFVAIVASPQRGQVWELPDVAAWRDLQVTVRK